MIKTYFNLKNYDIYIVTKHSNPQNRGHPPSINYLKALLILNVRFLTEF